MVFPFSADLCFKKLKQHLFIYEFNIESNQLIHAASGYKKPLFRLGFLK
jgi:hypothetical protein